MNTTDTNDTPEQGISPRISTDPAWLWNQDEFAPAEILRGHTSPETALQVDDYPYSFKLRCKIRYWIETRKGLGTRLVSQTTNPKRGIEVWNTPRKGPYQRGMVFLFRSKTGHVHAGCAINGYHCGIVPGFLPLLTPEERETAARFEALSRRADPTTWAKYDAEAAALKA